MAQVRLHLAEASGGGLPRVCMKCGARAAESDQRLSILWMPPWVYLLILACAIPYLIVSPFYTKSAYLMAPFCHRHRNHWQQRQLIISALCLLFAGNFVMPCYFRNWFAMASFIVLLPTILTAIAWVQLTSVRATNVTNVDLVIDGVCEEFIQAMIARDEAVARAIDADPPLVRPSPMVNGNDRKSDAIRE